MCVKRPHPSVHFYRNEDEKKEETPSGYVTADCCETFQLLGDSLYNHITFLTPTNSLTVTAQMKRFCKASKHSNMDQKLGGYIKALCVNKT